MKTLIFLLVIINFSLIDSIFASEDSSKIIWSCKKQYGTENILWLVEWGNRSYVKVFEERISAEYSMDGLEKRWNWGLDDDLTYNYAITLEPDLTAFYYNFAASRDGRAKPSEMFSCSK